MAIRTLTLTLVAFLCLSSQAWGQQPYDEIETWSLCFVLTPVIRYAELQQDGKQHQASGVFIDALNAGRCLALNPNLPGATVKLLERKREATESYRREVWSASLNGFPFFVLVIAAPLRGEPS